MFSFRTAVKNVNRNKSVFLKCFKTIGKATGRSIFIPKDQRDVLKYRLSVFLRRDREELKGASEFYAPCW